MSVEDKIKEIFENMTGKEEYDELSNSEKWDRVKEIWRKATNESIIYNKGNTLKTIPKVTESMKARRVESCFGKDGIDSCAFREFDDRGKFNYCNVCGCGGKNIARLDGQGYIPLDYPELKCPLKKLGFANELV